MADYERPYKIADIQGDILTIALADLMLSEELYRIRGGRCIVTGKPTMFGMPFEIG